MRVLILVLAMFGFLSMAQAEQTAGEEVKATAKTMKRKAKKGMHRAQESMCGKMTGDSKVECLAKEAKHRGEEVIDATKDKASEIKDKVDTK